MGIDGLGGYWLSKMPDRRSRLPVLSSLQDTGSWTFEARGVYPLSSKPNWGAILKGAGPEETGITSNQWFPLRNSTALPPAALQQKSSDTSSELTPKNSSCCRQQKRWRMEHCFYFEGNVIDENCLRCLSCRALATTAAALLKEGLSPRQISQGMAETCIEESRFVFILDMVEIALQTCNDEIVARS